MSFNVYILKSEKNNKSYIGHTADLPKRLMEHNSGKSISTRYGRPWRLVHVEAYASRAEAMAREKYYKTKAGRLELQTRSIL
jgi:putative endonuclease